MKGKLMKTLPGKYPQLILFPVFLCLLIVVGGCGGSGTPAATTTPTLHSTSAPPPLHLPTLAELSRLYPRLHLFALRGASVFNAAAAAPLIYHGGSVMKRTSTTYAIFWEPARLQDGTPTHVSSTYQSLIERYFKDVGGSGLYRVTTQYFDRTGRVVNNSTFGGAWVDHAAYPSSQCRDQFTPHGCLLDSQIQSEVTKAMKANHWTSSSTHLFFVYTSAGEGSCYDSTSTTCAFGYYCAYHSYYDLARQQVLYANMPYTSTVPRYCDVNTSPNHDIDADSTINVTSHEQMEAVTDPYITAWYDTSDNEIGDKCAWNFGKSALDRGLANVLWNSHYYIVQQEWSDLARGCILKS